MAVPGTINDGDFTIARQNGSPSVSFPFYDKGDKSHFVYRRPMRVDADYYDQPEPMSQRWFPLGRGYLVDIEPPTDQGQRLVDYTEIYANVPATRRELGNATWTAQLVVLSDPPTINSYTDNYDAAYQYEYSIFTPLPRLVAPRAIQTTATDGTPTVIFVGDYTPLSGGTEVLAQNSTSRIYMGLIYERLSIRVITNSSTLFVP